MGNFSRNTFDQTKNYVAVRLEQGVPLVDADWNELQDVTRWEAYEALRAAAANVASRGGLDVSVAGANDISVSAGRAVVGGWPIRLWAAMQYSTQRYANAANAAADGVPQATPLIQPVGARTDCVYLDAFEREITSAGDPTLINGAIGLETSTRLKREVVLRVAQGTSTPPAPAAGHAHLAIALLNRNAGPLTAAQVMDVKPYALPLGAREIAWAPALLPAVVGGATQPPFTLEVVAFPYRIIARKPSAQPSAFGIMQIPPLPDGARLLSFRIRGQSPGQFSWQFVRTRSADGVPTIVVSAFTSTAGAYDILATIPAAEPLVDNSTYYYHVAVYASGAPAVGDVYGGSIRIVP